MKSLVIKSLLVAVTSCLLLSAYAVYKVNAQENTFRTGLLASIARLEGTASAERGQYIASISGCISCHTDTKNGGLSLAGGVAIKTPFGTFNTPNITSDVESGIGGWSVNDLSVALTLGKSPQGDHYFAAFPYTSYNGMTARDLVDLKAWLDTVPAVAEDAPTHDLQWPFSIRQSLWVWKSLYFVPDRPIDKVQRGEYLVNGPAHCKDCHSPRNILGGIASDAMTGNKLGPDSEAVPGITATDLTDWTKEDIELFLEVGITPAGDFTGGHMADIIEYNTSKLTSEDRTEIAKFLLSTENQP